jgi:Tol biopolymer transport system component/predicted Ser/Thr protein kinase
VPIPSTLNHYRILGPLGKGGMGEVFAAEDTKLHRKVAIKVLSELTAADPERRQRFEREAQAIAALNHPNIVTIHAVEEADGLPFIVMELVDGQTLGDVLGAGRLPLDRLLRIGAAVSDAIGAAHQHGITHRDLKPGNVMVTGEGRVKVLDFGLAKLREAESSMDDETRLPESDITGEGRILGTVAYMSPEQAEGKAVDPRSDIFSLGVMLHEMAVGERPFKGDTNVSVLSSILKDTPQSITDLNPSLPPGLARIIRRSLSKDPSRRYQTAIDLRNELEELKQETDSGISSLSGERAPVARPPRALPWGAIAAGVAVLAVIAAVALWLRRPAAPDGAGEFDIARVSRLTSTGNAQQAAISADGRYVVHVKMENGRPSLWVRQTATTSDVQIAAPADVRYTGLSFAPDGNYIYYAAYPTTEAVATLYKVPVLGGRPQPVLEDVDSPATFSPDGRQMAFMRGVPSEGRVYVVVAGADGSGARRLATVAPPDFLLRTVAAWSPDGRTILALGQSLRESPHSLVFAVDVESGTAAPVGGRWAQLTDVDWMPDGGSFVVSGSDLSSGTFQMQLWQVQYPDGARHRVTIDLNTYVGVTVAGDGKSLATVQAESQTALWVLTPPDKTGGTRVLGDRGSGVGQAGIAWTPDGRIVYTASTSGVPQIWIASADGSGARPVTTGSTFAATQPNVAGGGRYLVYQEFSADTVAIVRSTLEGTDRTVLVSGGAFGPRTGGDGQWVYFTDNTQGTPHARRVSIDGGQPESLGTEYFSVSDVSPDGQQLLGFTWNQEERRSVAALMPAAGGPLRQVDLSVLTPPTFGPDGKTLVYLATGGGIKRNLWRRPLDGGAPEQITDVPDEINAWAWSRDGRRVLLVRGTGSTDVVIITRK